MKFLLDTNILIDVYSKREENFEKSFLVYLESLNQENECFISAKSIVDMHYSLKKTNKKEILLRNIKETIEITTIIDLKLNDLIEAYEINGKDFEDDVLVASAKRAGADIIITRNKIHFSRSGIKVMTPEEYLKSVNKDKMRVQETFTEIYKVT